MSLDDLLGRIDDVTAEVCACCTAPLCPDGPSPDFCGQDCAERWRATQGSVPLPDDGEWPAEWSWPTTSGVRARHHPDYLRFEIHDGVRPDLVIMDDITTDDVEGTPRVEIRELHDGWEFHDGWVEVDSRGWLSITGPVDGGTDITRGDLTHVRAIVDEPSGVGEFEGTAYRAHVRWQSLREATRWDYE